MSQRGQFAFYTVNSTEPGFNSTANDTASLLTLESTAVNRYWRGPSGRAVRVASKASDDFFITFGSSNAVATSSGGELVLGGTVEAFWVSPSQSHMSLVSSTDVTVNVTLGYGQ